MALSLVVSELYNTVSKNIATLTSRSGVIESGTIQYTGYDLLLVFHSNFVPKMHRFVIFDFKYVVTLKTGLGVYQGH